MRLKCKMVNAHLGEKKVHAAKGEFASGRTDAATYFRNGWRRVALIAIIWAML